MCTKFSLTHVLHRHSLYNDVMDLLATHDVVLQYPFSVRFEGEMGVDTGALLEREAFSTFWEEAYLKHFDGSPLLRPVICAGLSDVALQRLGQVLSTGYLVCSFLPA